MRLKEIAQPHIAAGKLTPLLQQWQAEALPLSIAYPQNRHLSPRMRVFAEWLAELCKVHPHILSNTTA